MGMTRKGAIKLFLKVAVSALCLWYISKKIDWGTTLELLEGSNKFYLIIATLFFALSKLTSAVRLNLLFDNMRLKLETFENIKLYWLGMFYNLFLPGGIGGDAYKVILLNRKYKSPIKNLTWAVLLDRVSGVVGLVILAIICFCMINSQVWWSVAAVVAIIPMLVINYYVIKLLFSTFLPSFYSTLFLGLAVQVLQIISVFFIMWSVGIDHSFAAYIFIFLASSVAAIFPFSIGGLGVREMVFLWGSGQFILDRQESVYISLLFYLITVFVSFFGIAWNQK